MNLCKVIDFFQYDILVSRDMDFNGCSALWIRNLLGEVCRSYAACCKSCSFSYCMKCFSRTATVLTSVQHNMESPLSHFFPQVALNLFPLVLKTRTNTDVSILLLE